ncbi:MAG: PfaD family polyunsaturated fatty acid/polyketide biosynthesis protein [Desulfobacteraceae bacterium]
MKPEDRDVFNRCWTGDPNTLQSADKAIESALDFVARPLYVVEHQDHLAVCHDGGMIWGRHPGKGHPGGCPLRGFVPPLHPTSLGNSSFKRQLELSYAYIVGAMANGITSVEMVVAAGQAGMVGFFGAGGLSVDQIESAIHRLEPYGNRFPVGFNLIHSPSDMALEMKTARLYIDRNIRLVSASAYLGLTLPLVYYRVKGIHQVSDGRIVCPNHVIAKVSREEVARKFFAPPPQSILAQLVQDGLITDKEAQLARHIPMAQDMTAEADSGGHTDNRPALSLLPTFLALRDRAAAEYQFSFPLRVGLGGGIATPDAAAAAFAMGAAYVLTGSINQAAVEADTSDSVREMLVQAQQADVIMAPAADMFELGAKVQVLKRGTMFAMRAAKLYDLYRSHSRYEEIPHNLRKMIEKDLLRTSFGDAWNQTCRYFETRDPSQIERANSDPKHKMALVFRSYLGQASLWAKRGVPDRQIDYQIWCGPAMGAFNAWAKGSVLEDRNQRRTDVLALNIMYGAARRLRCQWLYSQGVELPAAALSSRPLSLEEIEARLVS